MFNITWGELEIMAILLPIDAFNLYLLVKLWKWSQTVGKRLIGDVIKSLNLKKSELKDEKTNESQSIKESLGQLLTTERGQQVMTEIGNEALKSGVDIPIDKIISGLLTGQISVDDLTDYAPALLPMLKNAVFDKQNSNGEKNTSGRW